mmetsp:Transcript_23351/g.40712  ORF Transcript_23351/g.40712 Transcript_23351/m.40712 type:complete len:302 (-) Transcript_23351:6003-6908(-)
MCVPHGQTGHAELAGGIQGGCQTIGKSRLGKAHQRIHVDRAGARRADDGHHIAFDTTSCQLLAVALKVVEPTNAIAHSLGPGHGARHLGGSKGACPMAQQSRLNGGFNIALRNAGHDFLLPTATAATRSQIKTLASGQAPVEVPGNSARSKVGSIVSVNPCNRTEPPVDKLINTPSAVTVWVRITTSSGVAASTTSASFAMSKSVTVVTSVTSAASTKASAPSPPVARSPFPSTSVSSPKPPSSVSTSASDATPLSELVEKSRSSPAAPLSISAPAPPAIVSFSASPVPVSLPPKRSASAT